MKKVIFTLVLTGLITSSCVSKKEFASLEGKYKDTYANLQKTTLEKEKLEERFAKIDKRVAAYNDKINSLKGENVTLEKRQGFLENGKLTFSKDNKLILSKNQKKELGNILSKVDSRIVSQAKSLKDSVNIALDYKLKKSMHSAGMYNVEDIDVNVENTVVMISVSDKLLFKSGSYKVNKKAYPLLQKLTDVINSEPSMDVMIEGHTDSQSINTIGIKDNWDLSVKRATAIVRILEKDFFIKPNRLIASGRGSSMPLKPNDTKENRARNRRTRIVILPNLDKFFSMLVENDTFKD